MENNCKPKILFYIVYKKKEGYWRGFCSPFDVVVEADTQKQALNLLEDAVALYWDGLKKYKFPKHLSIKPLSDPEDEKVFKKALVILSKKIAEKILKDYEDYQQSEKLKYRTQGILGLCDYNPCFV